MADRERGNVRVLEAAIAALPAGITARFVRGDNALYEQDVLQWCGLTASSAWPYLEIC